MRTVGLSGRVVDFDIARVIVEHAELAVSRSAYTDVDRAGALSVLHAVDGVIEGNVPLEDIAEEELVPTVRRQHAQGGTYVERNAHAARVLKRVVVAMLLGEAYVGRAEAREATKEALQGHASQHVSIIVRIVPSPVHVGKRMTKGGVSRVVDRNDGVVLEAILHSPRRRACQNSEKGGGCASDLAVPVERAKLKQVTGGSGLAPCTKHAAASLDQLREHVDADHHIKVDTGSLGEC